MFYLNNALRKNRLQREGQVLVKLLVVVRVAMLTPLSGYCGWIRAAGHSP